MQYINPKLEQKLEFERLLLDTNTDLIFVKDDKSVIVEANQAFINLYPPDYRDKIIGYTTVEEYDPEEAKKFLEQDQNALREGISEIEESITFPNGENRTLLTKKIRFTDKSGKAFLLGVARDITHLKNIELALRNANQELEEFAYRTSHDLRSPLVSASALLGIIQSKVKANKVEETKALLPVVQNSISKLEMLVTDILKLTEVKHGNQEAKHTDIIKVLSTSVERSKMLEGYEDTEINISAPEALKFYVVESYLQSIFENLISNAIKYRDTNKANPRINLSLVKSSTSLVFTIQDNGLGIPHTYESKLFSMFGRFHPKTSHGSGLGLYMIKKLLEKMSGTIEYVALDDGSKFIVRIPNKKTSNR